MPLLFLFFRPYKMNQSSIYKEIWQDDQFAKLSRAGRLFVIYCLTNRNLKLIPVYKLSDREIMFDLEIKQSELDGLKLEIVKFGIFFLDGYCILKTIYKPFTWKGKKLDMAKENLLKEIPINVIESMESDTLLIDHQYSINRVNNNNNNNKSNNKSNNKEKPKFKVNETLKIKPVKKDKRNPEITEIVDYLKEKIGSLDDAEKWNRIHAKNLLTRLKKQYPDKDPIATARALIDIGLADEFHSKNLTNFRYLFNNQQKILRGFRGNRKNIIIID